MAKTVDIKLITKANRGGKFVDRVGPNLTKNRGEVDTVRITNANNTGNIKEPFTVSFEPNEAMDLFGQTFPEVILAPGKSADFVVKGSGKLRLRTIPARPGHDHEDIHIRC